MYRAFVRSVSEQKEKKAVPVSSVELEDEKEVAAEDTEDVNKDVSKEVDQLWQAVKKQCNDRGILPRNPEASDVYSDLGWIIVRVFVSSTFIDFFNEREVLVKKVFPELREWCNGRGMKLVECDLRWGIPKDTPSSDTILVCLDEIQRCFNENNGTPFFIGLIGERYGWIPKVEEVPGEAREKYGYIDQSSITFNEILVGAYRDTNPNAAFFFRDKSVCKDIPEPFYERYVEEEPLAKHHLKVMKKKLVEKFPDQVFHYVCKFKEISTSTGREQVEFAELEDFAAKVLQFLKDAIQRTYPSIYEKSVTETEKPNLEQTMQRMFIIDKARSLIGRQSELSILKEYVLHGESSKLETTEGSASTIRNPKDWDLHDTDVKVCVVDGNSGLGKTTLFCSLVDDCLANDTNIFYHMVGSTSPSTRVETLLERLVEALAPELMENDKEEEKGEEKSQDISKLQQRLKHALESLRQSPEKTMVICIDGLDQLESRDTLNHLSWLPPAVPSNVRCLVSTSEHLPTRARLYEFPVLKMDLRPLPQAELEEIMTRYLAGFSKRLEPGQAGKIIQDTGADSPLWVTLMSEELRIFGDFRRMAERIEAFPGTMHEFLVQVLERLIQEDDKQGVIRKALCLLACSRSGSLSSDLMLRLCGKVKAAEPLPLVYWARARRALKSYLRVSNVLEDTVTFAHEAVTQAVHSLLLATQSDIVEWHTHLADFYETSCQDAKAKVYNLPYHLQRANLKKRLANFVTKDKDSYKSIPPWERSNLLKRIRCMSLADAVIPNTAPVLLCHSCVTFKRYNPACMWPTKDCCVLCSHYLGPMGGPAGKPVLARSCLTHAGRRGPGMYKCLLCNMVVNEKPNAAPGPMVPTPARLCGFCGLGNEAKRCCHLSV